MTELNWAPFTFGGMLSTQTFPNFNMVGCTATALALMSPKTAHLDPATLTRHYSNGKAFIDEAKTQPCAIDDSLCLAAYSKDFAKGVLSSGPGEWFWRFTGFWPTCKYSAGIKPGIYGRLAFIVSLTINMRSPFTNQDGYLESAMMILAWERSGQETGRTALAVRTWLQHLRDNKQTLSGIFTAYSQEPTHPLVQLWGAQDKKWGLS